MIKKNDMLNAINTENFFSRYKGIINDVISDNRLGEGKTTDFLPVETVTTWVKESSCILKSHTKKTSLIEPYPNQRR